MSKVMKANDAVADAFAEIDLGSAQSDLRVRFDMRFDAAALAYWIADNPLLFFAQLWLAFHGDDPDFVAGNEVGPPFAPTTQVIWQCQGGNNFPPGTAFVSDAWHPVELRHTDGGTSELDIDGVNVATGPATGAIQYVDLGVIGPDPDPASVAYFRNVEIRTITGDTLLFSDDFSSGDLSAWTSTSGDVSVIDDPFAPTGSSAVRTLEGRAWKFIVTDLRTSTTLTAITTLATDLTVTRQLDEAWPATATVPSDDPRVNTIYDGDGAGEPFVAEGVRCLLGFRDTGVSPLWEIAYTGLILQLQDLLQDGIPISQLSAWSPRKYLDFLPVLKDDGTLPDQKGLTFTSTPANEVAAALLTNVQGSAWGALASTIFTVGTSETCAAIDITFQRGSMIGPAWRQLEQMGVIDILELPVYDPHGQPGVLAEINYLTQAGTTRNAAIMAWDRSPRSLPDISRLEDGTQRANTLQFFTGQNDDVATPQTDSDSIAKYGDYWASQSWPGRDIAAAVEALALEQLGFRKNGKTTVALTPAAARAAQPIQDYDIGDRVPLYASPRLRKEIKAVTRIYGIPFLIGEDGREAVDSLLVTADAVSE